MTFLTLDFLNDQRPKSRNQIVLSALRSRHISGNKTNKSSMSATVSRLKSAGVAEDYGKKIRLTSSFVLHGITIHERSQCLDGNAFRRYRFDREIDKPRGILLLKPFFLDFENNKAGEFYLAGFGVRRGF